MSVIATEIHNRAHQGDSQPLTVGYATLRVTNGIVAFNQDDRAGIVEADSDGILNPDKPGFLVALTAADYAVVPKETE